MIAPMVGTVAIVDDEADVRDALCQLLGLEGLSTLAFSDGAAALARIDADFAGIVVADLRMPGLDGAGLFDRLSRIDPELPVIMISGHGDIATAVDLVRHGAYDFLSKPFDPDRLLATIRRALDKRALALENRALRRHQPARPADALLGESSEIERLRLTIDQLVVADIDVLIAGESGTGKSLVASVLHRRSPRSRKAMVAVDCRALLEAQADSLLFGHVSGAFPGAQFPRTGQLVTANAGTALFDHVDGLSPTLQSRLQQVLEDGAVIPVGANHPQATRFRCLSSTAANLESMARDGAFLTSLFYKLGAFRIALPPLRARRDDVVPLFRAFLVEETAHLQREPPSLTPTVWRWLKDHDWPGNVRELRSFAANVALGLPDETPVGYRSSTDTSTALKESVARFEAEAIRTALRRNRGDIAATTDELGLPRKTLYDKLTRHGIEPSDYRPSRS